MIDIPLGKALVPVVSEKGGNCQGCYFSGRHCDRARACLATERVDSTDVVFKLVDYPGEGYQNEGRN